MTNKDCYTVKDVIEFLAKFPANMDVTWSDPGEGTGANKVTVTLCDDYNYLYQERGKWTDHDDDSQWIDSGISCRQSHHILCAKLNFSWEEFSKKYAVRGMGIKNGKQYVDFS